MFAYTPASTLALAALLVASAAHAQAASSAGTAAYDPLNLDFERVGLIAPDRPRKWAATGTSFEIALDSSVANTGKRSVRMRVSESASSSGMAQLSSAAPLTDVAGKSIHLRGLIRTGALQRGSARLWIRAEGAGGRELTTVGSPIRPLDDTAAWTPYEVSLVADSATSAISYGATLTGGGTLWLDSFSLDVNGRPASSLFPQWQPSREELRWLRAHAIPLATTDPTAPLDDLLRLGALIGDARVVALGEGTHGTADFFRMKLRLVRYLVERKGFSVFALETTMPEARRIDEYVRTGAGDVRSALAGLGFAYWNSREVLDIVEWIRRYNASGKGRVAFYGIDAQSPGIAMDSVRAFIASADASFLPSLDSAYDQVRAIQTARRAGARDPASARTWQTEAERVLDHVVAHRASYASAYPDSTRLAWTVQYARIVLQGGQSAIGGSTVRDSSMALNAAWIFAHQPAGARMIVSAFDRHVQRVPGWMGIHLQRRFADSLRTVGMVFGEGSYNSNGPRGVTAYPADPPAPGSVESVFRMAGLEMAALDLRTASRSDASRWLTQPHELRLIGTMANDNAFATTRVARDYDILIYLDRTRPSTLFAAPERP